MKRKTGITRMLSKGVTLILSPVLALFLAACSGGEVVPTLELEVIEAGRQAIAAKTGPKVPPTVVTRALLDTLDVPILEVTRERHDLRAYLDVSARRRDRHPGAITVWRTQDNVTLALRNGVLIGTQGLGADILSATVQVAGTTPGPSGGGDKTLVIRALDNKAVPLTLACDVIDLGGETLDIIGHRHATRHLRETCKGGVVAGHSGRAGTVVNEYWVDSRRGVIWQSRQWAGPDIGYLRLRRLRL